MTTLPLNVSSNTLSYYEYRQLSRFGSLEEFHVHAELWLEQFAEDFSERELDSLRVLIRLSEDVIGVSCEHMETCLEGLWHEGEDYYEYYLAFTNMLIKAAKLGIINMHLDLGDAHDPGPTLTYCFNRYEI